MQNMSFSLTVEQIASRQKSVTRRRGWLRIKKGDLICAVRKSMGLRNGESVERLAVLRVTDVRREPLQQMLDDAQYGEQECVSEGFGPGTDVPTAAAFVDFYCNSNKGCTHQSQVTRIAFEYLVRPSFDNFTRRIEKHLREHMPENLAKACVSRSRNAIGQLWANGVSAPKTIRKLWRETVVDGLERAPEAFIGLFKGANTGKMLVRLTKS